MRLVGSQPVSPQGDGGSSGSINYLVGPAEQWRTGLKAFSKVRYSGVYRGVDLVFYGSHGQLEHDFVVAPGAAPSEIQVEWAGARKLALDGNGDLLIFTASRQVHWAAPVVYQRIAGEQRRIEGGFQLLGGNRVGFRVGRFDPRYELVIDPTLVFSTYLGGSSSDAARGVAVDSSNNVYVTGYSDSLDLPVTKSVYQTGFGGGSSDIVTGDAFVAKYSSSGALIFLTYLGGSADDVGMAIAVDSGGNSYVAGYTNSRNFPTSANAIQPNFGGFAGIGFAITQGDAFVTKLSPNGASLVYSTYLGGNSDDAAFAIALDTLGDAYVTGTTSSTNFPVTKGAYRTTYAGNGGQSYFPCCGYAVIGGDVFVSKLNPAGSALLYSTLLGGSSDDLATTIALDGSGNAYVGGYTLSSDFPTTASAFQGTFGGTDSLNEFFNFGDGFVAKLNNSGSGLVYSTLIGGSGDDWVSGVAVDSAGDVWATGGTTSMNFPTSSGAFQTRFAGPYSLPLFVDQLFGDAFLLKFNPGGTALLFSSYLGGSGDDTGMAIALDGAGDVIVAGFTDSPNFPTTTGAIQSMNHGPVPPVVHNSFGDAFLAEFSSTGTKVYSTFLGGQNEDAGLSLALSPSGTAYIAGVTASSDFPTLNAAQRIPGGPASLQGGDGFVAAISGFSASGAAINSVVNATGGGTTIALNTWIEIFGFGLAPDTREWQSSDFVNGQLPTMLDGVSVTVNGKPAFVYYISPTQVNVLTPVDTATGPVEVQLTNSQGGAMASATAQTQPFAPGFFQFGAGPYVAATHANGSYIGPTTLYPGLTTPAKPNEVIVLYANGFGQTAPAIVNGSETATGSLTVNPTITIGGANATIQFKGLVAPGEYQFNIVVPGNLPNGDAPVVASFDGYSTQTGALITIHN